jgi:hypothetical protein
MSRWSRKKGFHWQKEGINTVSVMSTQLQVTPVKFLTTSRMWTFHPPKQERKNMMVRYVRQNQKSQKEDQLVERLHASLLMLHCDVLGIEDLIMGRIRMSSVDTSAQFDVIEGHTIDKPIIVDANVDDNFVCEDGLSAKINNDIQEASKNKTVDSNVLADISKLSDQIHTCKKNNKNNATEEKTGSVPIKPNTHYVGSPLQGFHMFRSFESRTWLTVEHIHLGLLLTEIVFQPSIHQGKLFNYTSCMSHQALAFWYKVSSECSQHNAYVALLAQICILFPDQKSITNNKVMINNLTSEPDKFYNNVYNYAKRRHDVSLIKRNFDSICNRPQTFSYSNRMTVDMKLQTLAYVTFKYYIKSKTRIQLKRAIEGVPESVDTLSKKKQKTTTTTASGPPAPLAFSAPNKKRTNCNICTLYSQLPTSTAAASSSIPAPVTAPTTATATNATAPLTSSYKELANDDSRWIGCKIATQESINAKVKSSLVVDVGTHYYKIETAPIEIYSCAKLKERRHWRETHSAVDDTSPKSTTTVITQDVIEFIDPYDNCHVVRLESHIFRNALDQNLQGSFDLVQLMRHTMRHGVADKRKDGRGSVINVGVQGGYRQHTKNGTGNIPTAGGGTGDEIQLNGTHFFSGLHESARKSIFFSIASIADLLWTVLEQMQECGHLPGLAPHVNRDFLFARLLRDYFGAGCMRFEWFTISVCILWPNLDYIKGHLDNLNSGLSMYSKTGALNVILEDSHGVLYLLQFIANFRMATESKLFPYKSALDQIESDIESYLCTLKDASKALYNSSNILPSEMSCFHDPFDVEDIYFDDCLPITALDIGSKDKPMIRDYVLMPIGVSRILSLSSIIAPIYNLRDTLHYDQLIELCFAGCLVNTPVRFNEIVTLMNAHDINESFGGHPFLCWLSQSMTEFGTWQGGPKARYSPCGAKDIKTSFQFDGPKITSVVKALVGLVEWMDSFHGKSSCESIPYDAIETKLCEVVEEVKSAVGDTRFEFRYFRIQVCVTILIGVHATKPGKHLHQLMIPSEGQASFDHLHDPTKNNISTQCASSSAGGMGGDPSSESSSAMRIYIQKSDMDQAMKELSSRFEVKYSLPFYCRCVMESCLCESKNGRELNKVECHRCGCACHHLSWDGSIVRKEYGRGNEWYPIMALDRRMKYLPNKEK